MKGISFTKILKFTVMAALLSSTSALAKVNYEEVYVSSGYPYADLVQRYDQVRIIYTEYAASGDIQCRDEFARAGNVTQTDKVQASLKKFKKAPLQACLTRTAAKQALAATFE